MRYGIDAVRLAYMGIRVEKHAENKIAVIFGHPMLYEPCCEKTGLRGYRLGPTQTGLYNHRR